MKLSLPQEGKSPPAQYGALSHEAGPRFKKLKREILEKMEELWSPLPTTTKWTSRSMMNTMCELWWPLRPCAHPLVPTEDNCCFICPSESCYNLSLVTNCRNNLGPWKKRNLGDSWTDTKEIHLQRDFKHCISPTLNVFISTRLQ